MGVENGLRQRCNDSIGAGTIPRSAHERIIHNETFSLMQNGERRKETEITGASTKQSDLRHRAFAFRGRRLQEDEAGAVRRGGRGTALEGERHAHAALLRRAQPDVRQPPRPNWERRNGSDISIYLVKTPVLTKREAYIRGCPQESTGSCSCADRLWRYAEKSAEHEAAYDALLTGKLYAVLQLLAPEVLRRMWKGCWMCRGFLKTPRPSFGVQEPSISGAPTPECV